MPDRRTMERRDLPRRSGDVMRDRFERVARLDDPADIARWELEFERATLASQERVRFIRERLGLA
jgi:hypothetical protein